MSMLTIPLDVHGMVKKLEENPKLDEAMIRGIVTGVTESHKAMVIATNQGLDELEKRVATKSDIADLKGEVGSLKGQIGDLKGDIGDLKGDIGGLEGQISNLRGELKEDIGNLKGYIAMFGIAMLGAMVALQHLFPPLCRNLNPAFNPLKTPLRRGFFWMTGRSTRVPGSFTL